MAEYRMTYLDIKNYVEECADKSSASELIREHLPEILAAVTAKANDDQEISKVVLNDTVTLWRNQIGSPSEIVLGTKYFSIKSNIIELIGAMISSGIMDTVILNCLSGSECIFQGITMGAVTGVASTLIQILKSASNLEDHDFCVYMQATTHFREYKEFTKDDLLQWFPHKPNTTCNMHNSKWDCEYYTEDEECEMLQDGHLDFALASLKEKKILDAKRKDRKDYYSFVK